MQPIPTGRRINQNNKRAVSLKNFKNRKRVRFLIISQEQLEEWKKQFPEFRDVVDLHPTVWINTNQKKTNDVTDMPVSREDVYEAETLWERFAPYFKKVFPET